MTPCRVATAALVQDHANGRVTPTGIWRHLKVQICLRLDAGLRLQVPQSWAKMWAAPAPLPGHNCSPLPADLPPRCRGNGCCPLHSAGHRGAQQAGLLGRRGHCLSLLCWNRQPPYVRDWWVSVGHSPSCCHLRLSSSRQFPHQLRCAFVVAQVPPHGSKSLISGGGRVHVHVRLDSDGQKPPGSEKLHLSLWLPRKSKLQAREA